ncbi:hypothetical protein BGZ60DRAFT_414154 [Tricladium varicosporioides]|nr:hypothetical protein BGZ60DRAFT_414154 [Hymenoscyphus varicosporioides]
MSIPIQDLFPTSTLRQSLLPLTSLIGLLGLSGGLYGLADPQAFSTTIGVPIQATNSPALPFISFVAARNLSSGITLLTLCASGYRKAAGIFLMCGTITAFADAWVCGKYGERKGRGKAWGHAIMGGVLGGLGWGLWIL